MLLAAAYVSDARYNRNILFETSPQSIRLYRLYNHQVMEAVTYFFILVDLALALFEDPAVYLLPVWATCAVELVCLLIFTIRLVHFAKVTPRNKFWKDMKNICVILTLLLTLFDIILYWTLIATGYYIIRWSRVMRPLFVVNFTESRQIRRAFRNIRNTLPEVANVFFLFMFSMVMFSLMGLKIFSKRHFETAEGTSYFNNYLDVFFDLYVLVTAANSPDVMMPAYNASGWYAIFFIVYIIINTYVFMSIFLAVVYNNYKKHLTNEVMKLVLLKRCKMIEAFKLLSVKKGTEFVVKEAQWTQLVKLVAPDISNSHRELLLKVSQEEQEKYIGKDSFIRLADLLNIKVITMKTRIHPIETWMPKLYNSYVSQAIQKMVKHRWFVYVFDIIIVINAIFIGLDDENSMISNAEWIFLSLYILEILLKLYVYEPKTFFARNQFWNWFDTWIIIAALLATTINAVLKSSGGYTSQQVLDFVLILRVLRLVRIVDSFQRFRVIMNTVINIGPTMLVFAGLIVVVYYVFAIIGMELFKGKIKFLGTNSTDPAADFCGNPKLINSAFAMSKYCKNNFNDIVSSFIILLELTVVNQWHACLLLANGFVAVTHPSARIFFCIFHIVVVILIINIFIAFILEAFLVEYSLHKTEVETAIEKNIQELGLGVQDDDPLDGGLVSNMETSDRELGSVEDAKTSFNTLKFRIASKRYRTVDAMLQRMFEKDLNLDDEGPSLEDILEMTPSDLNIHNPNF
uniref:Two pore segment channel 3 n=1 Tax=Latimeria chalumnae TaxID=7897 RepID=H3BCK6_LATCH